jgi:hypothetical protein
MIRCRHCRNRIFILDSRCCYCHRSRFDSLWEKALIFALIAAPLVGIGFLLMQIAAS